MCRKVTKGPILVRYRMLWIRCASLSLLPPYARTYHPTLWNTSFSSPNASNPQIILIGAGLYTENVTLYTPTPASSSSDNRIVLLGQTSHPMKYEGNLVEVQREEAVIDIPGESSSSGEPR
jgi:hypothetical protein